MGKLAARELQRVAVFAAHIRRCAAKVVLGVNLHGPSTPNLDRVVEMAALTDALVAAFPEVEVPRSYPWPGLAAAAAAVGGGAAVRVGNVAKGGTVLQGGSTAAAVAAAAEEVGLQGAQEMQVMVEGEEAGAAVGREDNERGAGVRQSIGAERELETAGEVLQCSGGRAVHWSVIGEDVISEQEGSSGSEEPATGTAGALGKVTENRSSVDWGASRGCAGVEEAGEQVAEEGGSRRKGVWQVKTPEPGARASQQDPQMLKKQLLNGKAGTAVGSRGSSPEGTAEAVHTGGGPPAGCGTVEQRGVCSATGRRDRVSSKCSSSSGWTGGGEGQPRQQQQGPERLNMWQKKLLRKGMGRIWIQGDQVEGKLVQESYQQQQQRPMTAGAAEQQQRQQTPQHQAAMGQHGQLSPIGLHARSCREVQWRTLDNSSRQRASLEVHGLRQTGATSGGRAVVSAGRLPARCQSAAAESMVTSASQGTGGVAACNVKQREQQQQQQQQQQGTGAYRAARASVDESMIRRCMAMQQHGFEAWSTGAN